MITVKINVLAIDKTRLFKGEKGTYLDCVLIETQGSQYGDDYMVVQSVTKEEREKGIRGPILGNAKVRGKGAQTQGASQAPASAQAQKANDQDVPF